MDSKATLGVLLGGLGLCGAACVLAPAAGSSALALIAGNVLVSSGKALAPNIAADLFSRFATWVGARSRDRAAAARNHDLRELLLTAVENVLDDTRERRDGGAAGSGYLGVLRRKIRERLPAALEDDRFRGIWEADVVSFFRHSIEDFGEVRALTPDLWIALLNEVGEYRALGEDESRALHAAASDLHELLPRHLVGVYRDALQHHPTVYVAVQTAILQELWSHLESIESKLDANSKETRESLAALRDGLAEARNEIRRAAPREYDDALAELRVLGWTTEWLARETRELVASLVAESRTPILQFLERPWTQRRGLPFHFSLEDVPLHGAFAHEDVPASMRRFLERPEPGLWWLWTGLEGAGKSRLALEQCRQAEALGWEAGFIPVRNLEALGGLWDRIAMHKPTLLVCDYAALNVDAVRSALMALHRHRDELFRRRGGCKLRLLLLERHSNAVVPASTANLPPQWCLDLFHSHLDGSAFLELQHPAPGAPSLHVGELSREEARPFALACVRSAREELARSTGAKAEPIDEEAIASRVLAILQVGGRASQLRPLHLRLTAFVLATLGSSAGSFEEVITAYLRSRIERRRKDFGAIVSDPADVDRIFNLVCVATILRAIRLDDVPPHAHLPGDNLRVNAGRLMALMGQPPESRVVQGLEPDLIGEWYVRLWCGPRSALGGRLPYPKLAEILDAIPHANAGISDFVQRTYRYPEFRDRGLWKRLRSRLGRYSTPFGRLFDSQEKQSALLGGRVKEAEECYAGAIDVAIHEAVGLNHGAMLVDLMAGGSERCRDLLQKHPRLRVIAVDRDISRIKPLEEAFRGRLFAARREIAGRIGLEGLLREHNRGEPCDIVIAKKALHEIKWPHQRALIEEIGECLTPGEGRCIICADSPDTMDAAGHRRLARILRAIRTDDLAVGNDQASDLLEADPTDESAGEAVSERENREHISELALGLEFDPENPVDAAVFANMWIALKDWANYNVHEYMNRYFSSARELLEAFAQAGMAPVGRRDGVFRFHMRLQASRFVEDAINRIGYMCSDSTVTDEEIRGAFTANPRFGVFRRIVEHHLWTGSGPTPFGRSPHVNARPGEVFDLDTFVSGMNSRLERIDFEEITGPTFDMPVHVFCLSRRDVIT